MLCAWRHRAHPSSMTTFNRLAFIALLFSVLTPAPGWSQTAQTGFQDDAWLEARFARWLRLRAGKDKTPIGYEMLIAF